jgi:hypothetical protein
MQRNKKIPEANLKEVAAEIAFRMKKIEDNKEHSSLL